MKSGHNPINLILSSLLFLALGSAAAPAQLDEIVLNEPPLPQQNGPAEPTLQHLPLPAIESALTNWVYLPFISKPAPAWWVNIQDRQVSLDFYVQQYLTSEGVPINWTGSQVICNPGTTSTEFRQAVLQRINYFRAMAGIPATITFSEESNRLAQAAALMMSVNKSLNHTPPSSWSCYSDDGSRGAGSSNLFLGVFSWDAISGYIRDPGDGNSAAGHRRWILHPPTQVMGTGDIPPVNGYPAANALRVFDDHLWDPLPPTRESFVAWPPPGYVPYQVIYPRWSFSVDGADFSAATVTIRSNGSGVSLSQSVPVNGYGDNTLVWNMAGLGSWDDWPFSGVDTAYDVTIQNVLLGGQNKSYSYTVIAFDPTP